MSDKLLPKELLQKFNEKIVGQHQAKCVLATAAFIHSNPNRLKSARVLLTGPSGTGKTALAREMARIMNVPFVHVNITEFTQSGYIGKSISDIKKRIISETNKFHGVDLNKNKANNACTDSSEIMSVLKGDPHLVRQLYRALASAPRFTQATEGDCNFAKLLLENFPEVGDDLEIYINITLYLNWAVVLIGYAISKSEFNEHIKKVSKNTGRNIGIIDSEITNLLYYYQQLVLNYVQENPKCQYRAVLDSKNTKCSDQLATINVTPQNLLTCHKTAMYIHTKLMVNVTIDKLKHLGYDPENPGNLIYCHGIPENEIIPDSVLEQYCKITETSPTEELRAGLLVVSNALIPCMTVIAGNNAGVNVRLSNYIYITSHMVLAGLYVANLDSMNTSKCMTYNVLWGLDKKNRTRELTPESEKDIHSLRKVLKGIYKAIYSGGTRAVSDTKENNTAEISCDECIVFIDEFDKISQSDNSINGKDNVGRIGVQRDLLGIMDCHDIDTEPDEKENTFSFFTTESKSTPALNSSRILFICAGAFANESMDGIINELKGRFNLIAATKELEYDDYDQLFDRELEEILTNYGLSRFNAGIELDKGAKEAIINKTIGLNKLYDSLGVRRLKGILNVLISSCVTKIDRDTVFKITIEDVRKLDLTDIGFSDKVTAAKSIGFLQ